MATNFEPHEYVIFVQSMKIGTHENKSIRSICFDKAFSRYSISVKVGVSSHETFTGNQ